MLDNQKSNPEKSEQAAIDPIGNIIFPAEGLKNGLIFLENPKSNLDIANLLSERVISKIGLLDLRFDRLQKSLFRKATDMAHNIFDFDARARESCIVHSRDFYRLAYDGASCRNAILGFLII